MILSIETSASYCSVALSTENRLLSLRESDAANDHASKLMYHIDTCLKDAGVAMRDLKAVAISQGPGSFTGLRVGASTAKGLCYALDIPLIAISTLAALADQALLRTEALLCIPMIWARKKEVYTAIYDRQAKMIFQEQVVDLVTDWHKSINGDMADQVVFCGNGAPIYQEIQGQNRINQVEIQYSATNLIGPATAKHIKKDYCVASEFAPSYLKSPHITQARKVL